MLSDKWQIFMYSFGTKGTQGIFVPLTTCISYQKEKVSAGVEYIKILLSLEKK